VFLLLFYCYIFFCSLNQRLVQTQTSLFAVTVSVEAQEQARRKVRADAAAAGQTVDLELLELKQRRLWLAIVRRDIVKAQRNFRQVG
jgi:hypothetical protein